MNEHVPTAQEVAVQVAEYLLKLQAVQLRPDRLFTWASGIQSPIYCDNRILLSHPLVRAYVHRALSNLITEQWQQVDALAGVATAGIPHASVVSHLLEKPMIYVRSKPKGHGRKNLIEGTLDSSANYVVLEDLISTGGSARKAVKAIRDAGGSVAGVAAIFTYGFQRAVTQFTEAACPLHTLTDFETLLAVAVSAGYITSAQQSEVLEWRARTDADV